jgi:hypothetical protein
MEFKQEDIKVIDEKQTTMYSKDFKITYPCDNKESKETALCNQRWIQSFSDCV